MGASRAHFAKPVKCGEQRIAPLGRLAGLRLEVEDDRHRAVVDQLDLHLRAEDARLHADAFRAERLDEALDERLRLRARRRVGEARPVALSRVGEQRELAHDQRLAARVDERAVEAALVVGEDPQPRDLRRKAHGRFGHVFVPGTDEHEEPCAAHADGLAVDSHGRA